LGAGSDKNKKEDGILFDWWELKISLDYNNMFKK
jgi:hypothetical protein